MSDICKIFIKVNENGKHPVAASIGSAGLDLFATENMVIKPGETKVMPLNFSIALPDNCEAQLRPRSGLSLKTNLRMANSPGTIDTDFRGIVGVILENNYNVANLPYELIGSPDLKVKMKTVKIPVSQEESITVPIFIDDKNNPYGTIYIEKGMRIAQMIVSEYKKVTFIDCEDPSQISNDRKGGFGSSGK
jgi:dUTP pyrophosphatase